VNPSRPYITRPVATSLFMAAILIVGAIGYFFLPLSALPEVDYPTIQVQTFLPGASPEVMTSTVSAPLERQFGQMPGLKEMSSRSPAGASILTLAVTSASMPITQVEDLADTRIAQKISQISGVGLVSINGAQRPAVRIQANLQALASYGLNIDDLRTTI